MYNYGDSGPSGLGPVSVTMHHAFGYALKGVSVMSLCSFRASVGSVFIVVGVVTDTLEQVNACNAERGTVWTVRPRATVKKLPSMPGDSYASVMWGQSCRFRYILPLHLDAGTFEPYSLGVFLTFALILFPLAKVWGILSGIKYIMLRNVNKFA